MRLLLALLFALPLSTVFAQDFSPAMTSPEKMAEETLRLISTDTPDWEAFRALFVPTAHFTVVQDVHDMGMTGKSFALEDFVRLFQNSPDRTFKEYQLSVEVNEYNGIAMVWQTYQVEVADDSNQGINCYQMIYHRDRWWICNVIWANDTNGISVPEEFLPEK
ncbi:hypothetical protein [Sanyastnella coralliicola]|uniref:hypothetical protein n=1 Tax=Sanyastnella coralliicola TaxID=3069118 RepID=UPI0027BA714E|nr:hypothetical protein [Longitalea sp. SCSIO 12813]